ncbi:DUF4340 domain-containing protein [Oceanispirochaeta crateris]|uniref:DUF4340 domain-containing protein n=1 Tax=Oceanispirochaeta crateris TaxID=2518645 RepID=A0A5C1QMW3_9SPIO|nr:DUF4340 domain-containing protein [Oceanispirochaeta crateris]QEN08857.1 DUF4340 domain-containing protein [Oceanispirochaeta crateris]
MKKKKQLLFAIAALVLIGGSYTAVHLLSKPKAPNQEAPATPQESYVLSDVSEDELKSITIENESGSYTLVLGQEGIVVENSPEIILDQQAAAGLTYTLMRLQSFEIIENDSSALGNYGLESPKGTVILEETDGSKTIVNLGNTTPSKNGYYALKQGENTVYLLSSYHGTFFLNPLDLLRDRTLPPVNFQDLTQLTITAEKTIEIVPYYTYEAFSSTLSPLIMVKPYNRPVAVNTQTYSEALESLSQNYEIVRFISEDSEIDTGLNQDSPRVYMMDSTGNEVTIRVGNKSEKGDHYCQVSSINGIVTLSSEALSLIDIPPLEMSDRFVRLIGIDNVKELRVETPDASWVGKIEMMEDETGLYTFQGESIEEDSFKKLYQEILYLLFEGEVPEGFTPSGRSQFTVTYIGNDENPGKTTAECYEYNMDFYAVSIDGYPPEFLIGKYQIENLLEYLRNFKA